MAKLGMKEVNEIKEHITCLKENGQPLQNYEMVFDLIETIENMQEESQLLDNFKQMQSRMKEKAKALYIWKNEAIDKTIIVLTEFTHKSRDEACKVLLKHLQNMPTLSNDLDIDFDDIPF